VTIRGHRYDSAIVDDPQRPSILAERDLTDDERAAVADAERPGVWVEDHETPEMDPLTYGPSQTALRGDGRVLSQEQTDALIVQGLYDHVAWTTSTRELRNAVGNPPLSALLQMRLGSEVVLARQQRGGIHSDPLVRLLAYRAWGDRDRKWTRRDTARVFVRDEAALMSFYGFDELEFGSIKAVGEFGSRYRLQGHRGDRSAYVDIHQDDARETENYYELRLDALEKLDELLTADGVSRMTEPHGYSRGRPVTRR